MVFGILLIVRLIINYSATSAHTSTIDGLGKSPSAPLDDKSEKLKAIFITIRDRND
jgi:hypothetical protein